MNRYFAVPDNGTWTDWQGGPGRRRHLVDPDTWPMSHDRRLVHEPPGLSRRARLAIILGSAGSLWATIGGLAYLIFA